MANQCKEHEKYVVFHSVTICTFRATGPECGFEIVCQYAICARQNSNADGI